jgi:hypothetical protein
LIISIVMTETASNTSMEGGYCGEDSFQPWPPRTIYFIASDLSIYFHHHHQDI